MKIEKGSEDRVTCPFRRRQSNSSNFIRNKEKPIKICEDIKNEVFELVSQGQNVSFTNSLKGFYYICGIKVQNNGSNVQHSVKHLSSQ